MLRKTKLSKTQLPKIKNQNNKIHVALVYGGMSSEREVSIMSFKDFNKTLLELGYKVTPVDMGYDIGSVLEKLNPDIVFNGLYGAYGEDGSLPGLLEILGIKYTHSGVLPSSIGFNKEASYRVFASCDIKMAKKKFINKSDNIKSDPLKRPYVIKPLSEGSSVGVILVFEKDNFNFAEYEWKYGDRIIAEEYIPGQELSVPVFGDKAIGVLELVPMKNRFYDYESKYTDNVTKHIMPAPIPQDIYDHLLHLSEKAHKAIGCKTLSRVDFRYNPKQGKDGCYILEINTHPGMTSLSIVPEVCAYSNISYADILDRLVQDGLKT